MLHLGTFGRLADAANAALRRPMPVEGIDVSHHQVNIDWEAVCGSNVRFAYVRATQGVDFVDRKLARNADRAAGLLPMGYYHFASWYNAKAHNVEIDARAEARHFVATCLRHDKWAFGRTARLSPVLDVELSAKARKAKGDEWKRKPGDHLSYAAVTDWVLAFLDECDRLTGRRAAIYTGRYFVYGDPATKTRGIGPQNLRYLKDRFLWLAQYNRGKSPRKPLDEWPATIWQYTGSGKCPGIVGKVDRNAFLGSRQDWLDLLGVPTEWTRREGEYV